MTQAAKYEEELVATNKTSMATPRLWQGIVGLLVIECTGLQSQGWWAGQGDLHLEVHNCYGFFY